MFQLHTMGTHIKTRVDQFRCAEAEFEIVEFWKG